MKIAINVTLDVDETAWANEFGILQNEVRADVKTYMTTMLNSVPDELPIVLAVAVR